MGRELVEITIAASVSRHNSEQDREDDAAMARLRKVIDVLLTAPEYERMGAFAMGGER